MKKFVVISIIFLMPLSNAAVFAEVALSNDRESEAINNALFNIYDENFYYVVMPYQNQFANKRMNDYNISSYPTIFFDGGYKVVKNENDIKNAINSCMERNKNISIKVNATWIECPCQRGFHIEALIKNNGNKIYNGILRIYMVEINSRWKSYASKYHFSFLEFAYVGNVTIMPNEEILIPVSWNTEINFPDIYEENNIAVIAALFNQKWQIKYSNPPDKNPFKAHYLDGIGIYMPDNIPPYISIISPREKYLYIFNREIMKFYYTFIIGPKKVEITTWDDKSINKIELYEDGIFKENLNGNSFLWKDNGFHSIKVVAYDDEFNSSDEIKAFIVS